MSGTGIRVDHYVHFDPPAPDPKMDQVLTALVTLAKDIMIMSGTVSSIDAAIADLTARVQADTDATSAASAMINGFAAQLAAAVAAAQGAGATPAQLASFTTLGSQIQANADSLSTAVTANTSAATPSVVPPVVPPASATP